MSRSPENGGEGDAMLEIIYRLLGTMGVGPMSQGAVTERTEQWAADEANGILRDPFLTRCESAERVAMRWPFADMPDSLPKGKDIPEATSFADLRKLPAGRLVIVEGIPARQNEESVRLWRGVSQEHISDLDALRLYVPELSLLRGVKLGLAVRLGEPVGEQESIRDATMETVHAVEQPLTELELHRGLRQGEPGKPLGYVQGRVARVDGVGQIQEVNLNSSGHGRLRLGLPRLTDISGPQRTRLGFEGNLAPGDYVRMRVAPDGVGNPLIVEPPVIHRLD